MLAYSEAKVGTQAPGRRGPPLLLMFGCTTAA